MYVLVNLGFILVVVVFVVMLDWYNWVIFIGIEMGGNLIVMGGGFWNNVKDMLNMKMIFMYVDKCLILIDLFLNMGCGLISDYVVEKNYEDFVVVKDV